MNNTFKENAEDLDIVMSIYNLLEYNGNYYMASGSLWNYYRDEINDCANEKKCCSYKVNNSKTIASKSLNI